MRIISKNNKPIKSYKSSKYCKILTVILYIAIFISSYLLITTEEFDIYGKIIIAIIIICFLSYLYWIFNSEFEIYNTHFTLSFNLIFLPYKIVFHKILFDDIDWVDGKNVETPYRPGSKFKVSELQIYFYLKNGKAKTVRFSGNENEFNDIIRNWKNIANYARE